MSANQIKQHILSNAEVIEGKAGVLMTFTHVPSGITISGICHRFTQKDELHLLNALIRTVMGSSWYDDDPDYCDACNQLLPNGKRECP